MSVQANTAQVRVYPYDFMACTLHLPYDLQPALAPRRNKIKSLLLISKLSVILSLYYKSRNLRYYKSRNLSYPELLCTYLLTYHALNLYMSVVWCRSCCSLQFGCHCVYIIVCVDRDNRDTIQARLDMTMHVQCSIVYHASSLNSSTQQLHYWALLCSCVLYLKTQHIIGAAVEVAKA